MHIEVELMYAVNFISNQGNYNYYQRRTVKICLCVIDSI